LAPTFFHLMSQSSNLYRLTTSHRAVQSKKRARQNQIKQVVFDEDDRRLLGFISAHCGKA
jgi:hypothetical protein